MIIPWQMIQPDTLKNLVEMTVSSEGTDNGDLMLLDDKVAQVMQQLEKNTAVITFDDISNTFAITFTENLSF